MVEQPDEARLFPDDLPNLPVTLLGVLPQREGDVVVQIHRSEESAVLEQHAELAPDPIEVLLPHGDDLLAVYPDLAAPGVRSPMMFFSKTDLPVPDAEDAGDAAARNIEADVLQDGMRPEGLRNPTEGGNHRLGRGSLFAHGDEFRRQCTVNLPQAREREGLQGTVGAIR